MTQATPAVLQLLGANAIYLAHEAAQLSAAFNSAAVDIEVSLCNDETGPLSDVLTPVTKRRRKRRPELAILSFVDAIEDAHEAADLAWLSNNGGGASA